MLRFLFHPYGNKNEYGMTPNGNISMRCYQWYFGESKIYGKIMTIHSNK